MPDSEPHPVIATTGSHDELPPGLVQAMLADPAHAPERLVLEAVRLCGPSTARWAQRVRRENPLTTTGELCLRTRERFAKISQASGAASGLLGLPGAAADIGLTAWQQARMVLALAALHGLDPTDRERAAEILYFTGLYKAVAMAEKALTVVGVGASAGPAPSAPVSAGTKARAVLALSWSLGRMLGKRSVKKLATRAIPFGAVPVGAWSNGRSTRALADRAVYEYAQRTAPSVPLHLKP